MPGAEFEKTCHLEVSPEVEILQNGRRRVIRRFELGKNGNIDDVIYRAYGDADPAEITACTTGYSNLRLVGQKVEPQARGPSLLVQVFETLTGAWVAEVDDLLETPENGLPRITRVLVALPGTDFSTYLVGAQVYSGLTLATRRVEQTDGVWRMTLVYGGSGTTSTSETISNNGALSTITIETQDGVPDTPFGYVLIATQEINEEGFETTRYTFVRGLGEISRQTDTSNNGALVTRSVRYLTAPAAAKPVPSDLVGFIEVSEAKQEADGHLVWTLGYAKGDGEISRQTDTSNNGALVTRSVRYLTAPAAAKPVPADLVGFIEVSEAKQEADGHLVWTLGYAKGSGEISRQTDTSNNGALTRISIRHLSGPAVVASPIATPAGYVLISEAVQEADGHRVWAATYARGTGEISRDTSVSNNGALTRVSIRALSAPAASNPISGPGGYVSLGAAVQEAEGHRAWSEDFVLGSGEVSRDTELRNNGNLEVVVITHLTSPSAADPVATLSGFVRTSISTQESDGHKVWRAQFAKGTGEISTQTSKQDGGITTTRKVTLYAPSATIPAESALSISREIAESSGHKVVTDVFYDAIPAGTPKLISQEDSARPDGSLVRQYTYVGSASASFTPPSPAGYYLVANPVRFTDGNLKQEGYTYIKPPPAETLSRTVTFRMPGLATASTATGVELNPGYDIRAQGSLALTYATSQAAVVAASPYWSKWSRFYMGYTRDADDVGVFDTKALSGYVGDNLVSGVGTPTSFAGIDVKNYLAEVVHPDGTNALPTGTQVLEAQSEEYLCALDGTKVYRNLIVSVTLP